MGPIDVRKQKASDWKANPSKRVNNRTCLESKLENARVIIEPINSNHQLK